jgi:hypothetical protein
MTTIMITIMITVTVTGKTEVDAFWRRRGEPRPR